MLRRAPTTITITAEDVAAYEDRHSAAAEPSHAAYQPRYDAARQSLMRGGRLPLPSQQQQQQQQQQTSPAAAQQQALGGSPRRGTPGAVTGQTGWWDGETQGQGGQGGRGGRLFRPLRQAEAMEASDSDGESGGEVDEEVLSADERMRDADGNDDEDDEDVDENGDEAEEEEDGHGHGHGHDAGPVRAAMGGRQPGQGVRLGRLPELDATLARPARRGGAGPGAWPGVQGQQQQRQEAARPAAAGPAAGPAVTPEGRMTRSRDERIGIAPGRRR